MDLTNLAPGIQDNVGMDSIRFGQTPPPAVPLPATALLRLTGLTLTAVTRQWRNRPRPQLAAQQSAAGEPLKAA